MDFEQALAAYKCGKIIGRKDGDRWFQMGKGKAAWMRLSCVVLFFDRENSGVDWDKVATVNRYSTTMEDLLADDWEIAG